MSGGWLGVAWLVAARELRQGTRARSFRIVTMLLVLTAAAAVVIPAALHHHRTTERVGIVGGTEPAASDVVRTAARIAGVDVQVVHLADLGAAESQLREGTLAAVLVVGREVLVKQAPAPGTTVDEGLSDLALVGGLGAPVSGDAGGRTPPGGQPPHPRPQAAAYRPERAAHRPGYGGRHLHHHRDLRFAHHCRRERGEVEPCGRGAPRRGTPLAAPLRQGARTGHPRPCAGTGDRRHLRGSRGARRLEPRPHRLAGGGRRGRALDRRGLRLLLHRLRGRRLAGRASPRMPTTPPCRCSCR